MALSDFPRHPLTFGPSPVHPLTRLTAHLGGAQIWAKRDDCNAGSSGDTIEYKYEYCSASCWASSTVACRLASGSPPTG